MSDRLKTGIMKEIVSLTMRFFKENIRNEETKQHHKPQLAIFVSFIIVWLNKLPLMLQVLSHLTEPSWPFPLLPGSMLNKVNLPESY